MAQPGNYRRAEHFGKAVRFVGQWVRNLRNHPTANNTSVMFPCRVSMENVYKEENHFTSRKKSQLDSPVQLQYGHNSGSSLPNDCSLERAL